ncbi:TPA: hypothetical protein ACH7A2_004955, partial [Escherichia coli]
MAFFVSVLRQRFQFFCHPQFIDFPVELFLIHHKPQFIIKPGNGLLIPSGRLTGKRLVRTVLIFTESSDQLSRATDRVPGLPA